jgi:hypothetical protein
MRLYSGRRSSRPPTSWADEIAIRPDDGASPVAGAGGPPPSGSRPRVVPPWQVAVAILLACSALVIAALWWQHRTRVIELTHRVVPYTPAGPDAMGCPSGTRCQVLADAGQPLAVLARRLFPDATVVSSVAVVDAATGRTVQSTIVLRTPSGVEVSALAQCVPGAAPIPARAAPLPTVGPAQADFVVAGQPGCSVAVAAQIPQSVPVPLRLLRRLASDPDAQLRPLAAVQPDRRQPEPTVRR